jgi:hypothetical protein
MTGEGCHFERSPDKSVMRRNLIIFVQSATGPIKGEIKPKFIHKMLRTYYEKAKKDNTT